MIDPIVLFRFRPDLPAGALQAVPHPAHQRVVERLLPMLEGGLGGVVAFDFRDGVL